MRKNLNWQINSLYKRTLKRVPSLITSCEGKIHGLYNPKRERIIGKQNIKTYEGYLLCGAMSHIIYDSVSFPIKKQIFSKGIGKNFEDHMFLKTGDTIICPTYRQMFRSYCGRGGEDYFKMLYEDYPPFFVGNITDLQELYTKLNNQHIKDFGEELENKLDFYTNATDYNKK